MSNGTGSSWENLQASKSFNPVPHLTGGTEDLCIFLKLHFSVFLTRILNFSLFSLSSVPPSQHSNCRPSPNYSASLFMLPVILVLMGCIGKGGNTEFSSPHFRELLKVYISILFPGLRQCLTSHMLKSFRHWPNGMLRDLCSLSTWSNNIVLKTIQDLWGKGRKRCDFLV